MGAERVFVVVYVHHLRRPNLDHARVIDQDVDLPKCVDHGLNHFFDLLPVGHIAGDTEHSTAVLPELGGGSFKLARSLCRSQPVLPREQTRERAPTQGRVIRR